MKYLLLVTLLFPLISVAESSKIFTTRYEHLDFDHSIQKIRGDRMGLRLDIKDKKQRLRFDYEKTDTKTIKPLVKYDLKIDKYYVRYDRKISSDLNINVGLMQIDDSLAATDGGKIYGVGVRYKNIGANQYLSDYDDFNVNQTDLSFSFNSKINSKKLKTTLVTKYIHLDGKDSNGYSKNAKSNYLMAGIKLNTKVKAIRLGANAFFGQRAFMVMQNGFKVQHHAQEFSHSYGVSAARKIGNADFQLKYAHLKGEELPRKNPNVKTDVVTLAFRYDL